jgi:hypothetical protein
MYVMKNEEVAAVSGGVIGIMEAIGIGVCIYEAANILYQAGEGVVDGYKDGRKVSN